MRTPVTPTRRRAPGARSVGLAVLGTLVASLLVGSPTSTPAHGAGSAAASGGRTVHLVTLAGPGTAGPATGRTPVTREALLATQDRTLAGLAEPLYRWTTALNGYAVPLTEAEADRLAARPEVVAVERDAVRPMASTRSVAGARGGRAEPSAPGSPSRAVRGGAGVVVGVVDSGVDPDSPVVDDSTELGREPAGFRGRCRPGPGWPDDACGEKLVASDWFVRGFGQDRLASSATLSGRDDVGHGTSVVSVAAGNGAVGVVARDRLGSYSGIAPQARVASYKACWSAPDPSQDGCATSDLVAAVDRATADGVDVLSVAVGGPARPDTLDRALVGAAEADVVVVAAAGNTGGEAYAGHASPGVLTVGAHTTPLRRARLDLPGGVSVTGAMASRRRLDGVRLVRGADAALPGAREDAALCTPGSLDAARVDGAAVVCTRGAVSRLEKSTAVDRAGGSAMVLVNQRGAALTLDLHRVPVLHLAADEGRRVERALAGRGPAPRVDLVPDGEGFRRLHPAAFSATGDPAGPVLAPSLLAPGVSVLGAVPPSPEGLAWRSFSGTSAAAASVAGAAARLRALRPGWAADRVRSALRTSALPLAGDPTLAQGSGRMRPALARDPGLVLELPVRDLRRYLDGDLAPSDVNTPSVVVRGGPASVVRRVRNVSESARYFSSRAEGFTDHRVVVRPAALRLGPGESGEFVVEVGPGAPGAGGRPDDGTVTWAGADGTRARIPVVVSR
ncbi:S8 family serine peptidase [uncultured Nocardioides sp.]|uniref:S8 family serine peptidase n=1 Tax=uncultured Nocardioides sp. TaxID=198441 RepID=UPI00263336B1|nr:S8 family serine peptidase [uncultured Nocardioides sp.]